MTYELCIWDPERHGPLPASAAEALETMERLADLRDDWRFTLHEFVVALGLGYEGDHQMDATRAAGFLAFWGSDPAASARACESAVYRLAISPNHTTRQISYAVEAAAGLGLVIVDDEIGTCFLPDGTLYPEEDREMWDNDLEEMRAGPVDPAQRKGDGRTFLERLGSDLLDVISLGNKRQ